jgi:poly(hydroxyalkanoate) depolymerase family esterase
MRYRLFVPRVAQESAPLLVALHGCTQSAADFAAGSRLDEVAGDRGMFVLYPELPQGANPQGCWNWFLPEHQRREFGEPQQILDRIAFVCDRYPIDRKRIYLTGMSAGGAMAAILAEQAPDIVAGAAIVAGVALKVAHDVRSGFVAMRGFPLSSLADITGRVGIRGKHLYGAMRVLVWSGSDDAFVHSSNAVVLARQFAQLLGVDQKLETERSGRIAFERWRDRSGRLRVELWQVDGLGHAWSGGSLRGSFTDPRGPDASTAIVEFFLGNS